MPSAFQNPRNPLSAFWASAVETHLRNQNPELSSQQLRQLPMMQGVYDHLSQLKEKKRVDKPPQTTAEESDQALKIAQMAYLSQALFDLAVTTAAFYSAGDELYEDYINWLGDHNNTNDIADFSSEDICGFALCVIVWIGLVGLSHLTSKQKSFLDFIIAHLPISQDEKNKINDFWNSISKEKYSNQYRDAAKYSSYKTLPWKIPNDAQIVMLGDWGTSLDDAHAFLKTIWRKAYQNNPGGCIVFIHLGDIYYCGLPYECQHNFYEVFVNAGQELRGELGADFNPNPPIFTIPGNHEYYSYGYGYFQMLDTLNQNVPGINHSDIYQQCSFFCLQTANGNWQFLGMDTGRDDGNALLSALQGAGDLAKEWLDEYLPQWGWIKWIENLAVSTYEDFVGPFQPTLDPDELNWHKDRLGSFGGKTIMLSHHQLFSREARINHNNPEYMNTWLDKTFNADYKDKIAAWYWGHEHTFAVYLDGLWGLNKGRLLGSSSYETTEGSDTPYSNNYPMVPFAKNMNGNLIHKSASEGLYYHSGAIMSQNGSSMQVKYYQFPAWSQLVSAPVNLQLEEITAVAENITSEFKSLKPTWIGNTVISENEVTTNLSPSITTWNKMLYMVYTDNGNSNNILTICTADVANYKPVAYDDAPDWSNPVQISVNNKKVETQNSPATIAVNGKIYVFYRDSDKYLHGIVTDAATGTPGNWTSIGQMPDQVNDCAPAACFFQGRIYIIYRKNGSSNDLGWAYYDIERNSWFDFGLLEDRSGNKFESPNPPSLAADAYHIYMVYQQKDHTNIRWAVGTPSSPMPSGASDNNISWTDKGEIRNAEGNNPDTEKGLTLEYANGVFLLVYTSTNNNLTQLALNGTGETDTGNWIGNNTVTVYKNSSKHSVVGSGRAPALAVIAGGGFLVYRGNEHDEIYWAYY